ncbi:MAG TPA: SMI1/KNR4 family protein [Pyrinomonadaceae bacterium]|nr:SMI1/KNR4 family protein [Pyrinomonadaceae bacterium]
MSLTKVYSYFRTYDKASFEVFACQGHEPSDKDVRTFEGEVGFSLPDEFREFTKSSLGGLYMAVRESLWPRPQEYAVGPFWSFLYGLMVYGMAEDIPDFLDVRIQYREFLTFRESESDTTPLVPFLKVIGDPDIYCFDRTGQIVRWQHEEPDELKPVELTFSQLLMREIQELEDRKERKIQEAPRPGA